MEKQQVEQLFLQHYAKMYKVALTILYNEQESKDVVSNIFEHLLRSSTMLYGNTTESYLLSAVRNECRKLLLTKSRRQRISQLYVSDMQLNTSTQDDEHQLQRIVNFAKCHLTERELTAFRLRFICGMSYADIALEMEISKVAVWKHLSGIMQKLKRQFNISEQ